MEQDQSRREVGELREREKSDRRAAEKEFLENRVGARKRSQSSSTAAEALWIRIKKESKKERQ